MVEMKVKIPTSLLISSFLIFLMVGSTLTYFLLQAFRPVGMVVLPEKNIIDYELSVEQENLAIQKGKTLVKFYYSQDCEECELIKNYLEDFANKHKDQIILQKITTNSSYEIKFSSFFGKRSLKNCTEQEIFKAFCDLMFNPPVECVRLE